MSCTLICIYSTIVATTTTTTTTIIAITSCNIITAKRIKVHTL